MKWPSATGRAFAALLVLSVLIAAPSLASSDSDPDTGPETATSHPEHAAPEDPAPEDPPEDVVRPIVFPIDGHASFWNDWHQPRDNGARLHLGTDIAAPKLTPVVAATDGVVARIGPDDRGRAGNWVVITDADDWEYAYLHLNNDAPGTDDNSNPSSISLAPGIEPGAFVAAGQVIGFVGDSGNAETTIPHVHFEIRAPGRVHVNPFHSLQAAYETDPDRLCAGESPDPYVPRPLPEPRPHLVVASNGTVIALDGAAHHGDLGGLELDGPIVAAAMTPGGGGYWLLGSDGGVFAFGDAVFHGSLRTHLEQFGRPGDLDAFVIEQDALIHDGSIDAVDIVAARDGSGYWVLMANGETVEFGAVTPLHRPIVTLEAPAVRIELARTGAWIVARDGGVFAIGGAPYHGSIPERSTLVDDAVGLDHESLAPVIGLIAAEDDTGYSLVAADGTVQDFGSRRTGSTHAASGRCEPGEVRAVVSEGASTHRVLLADGYIRTYGDGSDPLDDRRVIDAVDVLVGPPVIGGLA